MQNIKRRGIVSISPEEFFELLGLQNAILLDAQINHFAGGNLDVAIESPDMPECQEGAYPVTVMLRDIKPEPPIIPLNIIR